VPAVKFKLNDDGDEYELKTVNGSDGEALDAVLFADTHSLYFEVTDPNGNYPQVMHASICLDYRTARKFAKAILKAQDKLR
jgi:hypothetical protein